MTNTSLTRVEPGGSLTRIEVRDAPVFHNTVARAVGGAAGGALLVDLLSQAAGYLHPPMWGLILATLAGSLTLVGSTKDPSKASSLASAVGAAAGGALGLVGAVLYQLTAQWPWLGALLAGVAAAPILARGESPSKMATTGVFTGAMAYAGLYVLKVLARNGLIGPPLMPGPLATAIAGAAAGLFIGLGALPRYLGSREDSVETAFGRAVKSAEGEILEILDRSFTIYRAIRADLAGKKGATEKRLGRQVSDLAMRILHISEQCQKIQRDLGGNARDELEQRIADLNVKVESAQDPAAKRTLKAAIESLDGQRRAREAIGFGLERVIARLHANVAMLEKVRFSLVHARSADAERFGGESSPLADTIDELSRELDATSVAVGEVFSEGFASEMLVGQAPAALPAKSEAKADAPIVPSAIATSAPDAVDEAAKLFERPMTPATESAAEPVATQATAPSREAPPSEPKS
ncbi:MAG: hypothetical protein HY791_17535 [Deltaproteobacteria bacterium]|nr:hypothetical protein [Deltaproteobacteria bacterium]